MLLTHYQFPEKGGKIRRYPIPKCDTWRSCVVIFFTQFVSTATIASPHSALRKR
ncbi:hypothetical protein A674_01939 [Salmonella enterica subsp. enterica serovar Enteritidis str. 2009K1651]|uniref:Uncharacterized protein n=3 Tax=Salmonella enterica I TaxID=59201 RepID=M7RJQ6_SALDU|nr:hypothetical protein SPAB_04790 [Salmonella enterica subsp. enterica serovar Paratyphi B str. SPB7]EFX50627.1 hypothetical protein SEE_01399 [Salmonella enterica subsp. enterica serovar Typhimurium str. TN061786]EMR51938.1 hypothetical protein A670_02816 [Salmonella enterica subsp. enterica serovar Dublin str. UC16]EPI67341.1 hypothetical protein A671_03393 [Salmonella enterica subsp. enterica serovar Dublin str. DG22]EPI67901.1 hypothetical protein A672_03764 [Salmonella enterica subsp. ent